MMLLVCFWVACNSVLAASPVGRSKGHQPLGNYTPRDCSFHGCDDADAAVVLQKDLRATAAMTAPRDASDPQKSGFWPWRYRRSRRIRRRFQRYGDRTKPGTSTTTRPISSTTGTLPICEGTKIVQNPSSVGTPIGPQDGSRNRTNTTINFTLSCAISGTVLLDMGKRLSSVSVGFGAEVNQVDGQLRLFFTDGDGQTVVSDDIRTEGGTNSTEYSGTFTSDTGFSFGSGTFSLTIETSEPGVITDAGGSVPTVTLNFNEPTTSTTTEPTTSTTTEPTTSTTTEPTTSTTTEPTTSTTTEKTTSTEAEDCSFRTVMFDDPSAINSSVGTGSKAILSFEVSSGCCINNNTVVVSLDVKAGAEDQSSEDSLQDPGGNSLEDAFFRCVEDRENGEFRYETTFYDCAIIGNALQGTWTMEFETTVSGTIGGVAGLAPTISFDVKPCGP